MIITYVSSKGAFTFILLYPHQLQKGAMGVGSKQDLVLFGVYFLFFFASITFQGAFGC